MTYHVTCPYSKKDFPRETLTEMRRFIYAMMMKMDCKQRVWIKDGKVKYGSMWKVGNLVLYRSKGVRVVRMVNKDGSLKKVGRK